MARFHLSPNLATSREEFLGVITRGAETIINSSDEWVPITPVSSVPLASTLTDDDIQGTMQHGEERTAELNAQETLNLEDLSNFKI